MLSAHQPGKSSRYTLVFVWGGWLLLSAVAILYVWQFGSNVPSWDDWDMVPAMTHQQPITIDWLWSQHNEHRVPLARLIMLSVYRIWPDFRACMYLNVVLMAGTALILIRCAERIRGYLYPTDIFFPLALLGLAQGLNFIWAWQVEFFTSTCLALFALLFIAGYNQKHAVLTIGLTNVCLILLCISGAHGLALVPALVLWTGILIFQGVRQESKARQSRWLIPVVLFACVLGLFVLYLHNYERVPYFPTTPGILHTLKTAVQFLAMSFGPAVKVVWPVSGLLISLLLSAGMLVLAAVIWRNPAERPRAAGFAMFLAAMGSLALAIGLGRNGFEPRYITLAVPVLCGLYLIFTSYVPGKIERFAAITLVIIACLCVWPNTQSGFQYGNDLRGHLASFERDMMAGTPSYQLIYKYHAYLHPNEQLVTDYLPLLKKAGIGNFRMLRDNPPFREVHVPLVPVLTRDVSYIDSLGRTADGHAYVVFRVPEPLNAVGIRVRFSVRNQQHQPPFFFLSWRADDTEAQVKGSYYVSPTGDHANWARGSWMRINQRETETTVWIADPVRDILIQPDSQPCTFSISELTLLLPQ